MINEVLYCERLMYLEWAQGEFDDNAFTVEGRAVHARVDKTPQRKSRKRVQDDADLEQEAEPPPYQARSVWLSSEKLRIIAKIDIIDEGDDGAVVPVEYKRGSVPDLPEQAYLPERAQVAAQGLLLREHGYRCEEGSIYFARDRRRVAVPIDSALEAAVLHAAARARELAAQGVLPPPLVDSPKCYGCSLVGICLPDETALLKHENEPAPAADPLDTDDYSGPMDEDPWGLVDARTNATLRRLHAARDDRLPLYVQTQGGYISLDGERLVVKTKDANTEARLPNTSQVCIMGNVQISTAAVRALLERAIPLSYFTYGGWFLGRTFAHDTRNIELRVAQHAVLRDTVTCLTLARGIVVSKILNSRTMLRRNTENPDETVLFELKQLARKAGEALSIESLLGVEGSAARTYFGAFAGMLKSIALTEGFDLDGRNRRPPRDPLNALLSFAYSLLVKDVALAIVTSGLDPLLGFYHQPRFGRPALALDLMEEFRPLIADSVVIGAVNTAVIGARDFIRGPGACALTADARRRFILAYERRMDQLVTHPVFGYRISYRRVLEVQARLLGRRLLGEIDEYPAFRTR
jgi:CRISPR-associated protein Cas1